MKRLLAALATLCAFSLACAHPGGGGRRVAHQLDEIDRKVDRVLEGQAQMGAELQELIALSRAQGSGEITLFFGWQSARLAPGSEQHDRLVAYLDRLSFEARGRTILLTAIGAAGDWKRADWADALSKRRAEAPRPIVARHLVNVPHRWLEVYGVGSRLSPADPSGRTWRQVRVIAVYDESQLPALPAKP